MRDARALAVVAAFLLGACDSGGSEGGASDAGADAAPGDVADEGGASDGEADAGVTRICPAEPGPDDLPRRVVYALPYHDDGGKSSAWGVGTLASDCVLNVDEERLTMGRAAYGHLRFSADGSLGFVAQEDGTVGVLRVGEGGAVEVLSAGFAGDFWASDVRVDPDGEHLLVLDGNWPDNGGGVYRLKIGEDGALTDEGLIFWTKLISGLVFLPDAPGLALVAAKEAPGSTAGHDLHVVDTAGTWTLVASADAFAVDDYIACSLALAPDGRYALIGENNQFSGKPNRVAMVAVSGLPDDPALTPAGELSPIEDPADIVFSPFGGMALVLSGTGDALLVLDYDPDRAGEPFLVTGEVAYAGSHTALPVSAAPVLAGAARGIVLVSENTGIRALRFEPAGGITDLGLLDTGPGFSGLPGAIGIQP